MKIKCVAVDDEPLALEIIRDYCSRIPYRSDFSFIKLFCNVLVSCAEASAAATMCKQNDRRCVGGQIQYALEKHVANGNFQIFVLVTHGLTLFFVF